MFLTIWGGIPTVMDGIIRCREFIQWLACSPESKHSDFLLDNLKSRVNIMHLIRWQILRRRIIDECVEVLERVTHIYQEL